MGVSMGDIESKYFIDDNKYNCPFCKNRGVKYIITGIARFNEKCDKDLYAVFVKCSNCHNVSMHLVKKDNFVRMETYYNSEYYDTDFLTLSNFCSDLRTYSDKKVIVGTTSELKKYYVENERFPICEDEHIIMSIPTSFFTIDERIPKKFRDLIEEAEKCIQNNCLTGASACIRKTIYEFLIKENAQGNNYDEKIKSLKGRCKTLDDQYIDMIAGIQGIMCDQVHESTVFENFTSRHAKAYIAVLKEIFNHFYVLPKEASAKKAEIDTLFSEIKMQK